jgi:hypothetical protein
MCVEMRKKLRRAEQVIAPKRETATFLFSLCVKFYVVACRFRAR